MFFWGSWETTFLFGAHEFSNVTTQLPIGQGTVHTMLLGLSWGGRGREREGGREGGREREGRAIACGLGDDGAVCLVKSTLYSSTELILTSTIYPVARLGLSISN